MRSRFVSIVVLLLLPGLARALEFNRFIIFGDSLSDTGNILRRTFFYPRPPDYAAGRFTCGPQTTPASTFSGAWHELLAPSLGVPVASPSLLGGRNYAFGGANTGPGTSSFGIIDNLGEQVSDYLAGNDSPADALVILFAGGNDLLSAAEAAGATPQGVLNAKQQAVANIEQRLTALISDGGQQFLLANLPPMNRIPRAATFSIQIRDALGQASLEFRDDLLQIAAALQTSTGAQIIPLDVYALVDQMVNSPAAFGLTNVTSPAMGQPVNPDLFLFWDDIHPTSKAHNLLAQFAYQVITQASAPALVSAASRRTHGSTGAYDIALQANGPAVIEPRGGNVGTPQVVLTYSGPPGDPGCGGVTLVNATCVGTTVTGNDLIIDMTLNNNTCIELALGGDTVRIFALAGDTTGNGKVTSADVNHTIASIGAATGANARNDVNADGIVDDADVNAVKAATSGQLPQSCSN